MGTDGGTNIETTRELHLEAAGNTWTMKPVLSLKPMQFILCAIFDNSLNLTCNSGDNNHKTYFPGLLQALNEIMLIIK